MTARSSGFLAPILSPSDNPDGNKNNIKTVSSKYNQNIILPASQILPLSLN